MKPNGKRCKSCGTTDAACRSHLFDQYGNIKGPCCQVCAATHAHGQDMIGYVPPWQNNLDKLVLN